MKKRKPTKVVWINEYGTECVSIFNGSVQYPLISHSVIKATDNRGNPVNLMSFAPARNGRYLIKSFTLTRPTAQ